MQMILGYSNLTIYKILKSIYLTAFMVETVAVVIGGAVLYGLYSSRFWLPKLRTVPHVDLKRYAGTWYEIARLPTIFEKKCSNVRETYTLRDGYIDVHTEMVRSGRSTDIYAKAYVEEKNNSKLSVYFSRF
jgi:apolipoprotein D and lipocalin family protein